MFTRMSKQRTIKFEAPRLNRQLDRVRSLMNDGVWRSLDAIRYELDQTFDCQASTPSISARLRDLRKEGYTVERKQVKPGLFEYRVIQPIHPPPPPHALLVLLSAAGGLDTKGRNV